MGAEVGSEHGFLVAETAGLRGAAITLDYPSVGATENLMMAAVRARGTTVIDNAAREPEIADIAAFLVAMGARIEGAGTNTIEIDGVDELAGTEHVTIPDRIEAGTWAAAAVATGGDLLLEHARADHLDLFLTKLADAGALIDRIEDGIRVRQIGRGRDIDFVTLPYPGVATDFQPILMAMLATGEGTSIATENVFESRFLYVDELRRMGANIEVRGRSALVHGVDKMTGAQVMATDLRASMSLVLAGLAAEGETEVLRVYHLDRGYERLEEKLSAVGATIERRGGG